jgi:hypothetical protein
MKQLQNAQLLVFSESLSHTISVAIQSILRVIDRQRVDWVAVTGLKLFNGRISLYFTLYSIENKNAVFLFFASRRDDNFLLRAPNVLECRPEVAQYSLSFGCSVCKIKTINIFL